MLNNQTYETPGMLGDLVGAYDQSNWNVVVLELKPNSGVLKRGSVLSLVAGKLELTVATNQTTAYGILLDPLVDTSSAYSDGSVTGSLARQGSFRGAALIVGAGVDPVALAADLRTRGIFTEGAIVPPTSLAADEAAPETPVKVKAAPEPSFEA